MCNEGVNKYILPLYMLLKVIDVMFCCMSPYWDTERKQIETESIKGIPCDFLGRTE